MQTRRIDDENSCRIEAGDVEVPLRTLKRSSTDLLSDVYSHTGLVRMASSSGRIHLAHPNNKREGGRNEGVQSAHINPKPNWRKLIESVKKEREVVA